MFCSAPDSFKDKVKDKFKVFQRPGNKSIFGLDYCTPMKVINIMFALYRGDGDDEDHCNDCIV